jgi:3-oxoacyl-[acyl-carrier-protein] synthase II
MRRVVVTGMGIICPLGNDINTVWQNILQGKSGIKFIDSFDTEKHLTKFAGLIQNFNPEDYIPPKEVKKCDPFIQYGIAAALQALKDAGFLSDNFKNTNLERFGVMIGSGIGGIGCIELNNEIILNQGPKRISPFFIPASLVNMISGHISIMYGLKGPNLSVVTACATATHSIGLSARLIKYGDADIMLAGGSERASTPLCVAGFNAMKALSTKNQNPQTASRPWDEDRDGFVLGDGAGVLVLEEYQHAKNRGANIYAEISGFGMSADASHITKPAVGGEGARLSMELALKDARLTVKDVDYINAHATSTPIGDVEESIAIENLFGDYAKKVLVSSTKSMTGHLLGATGAIEAIFAILSIRDNIAPPTINLQHPSKGCVLDYVPNCAREVKDLRVSMSNSFGFGGTNGTLVFNKI